MVNYKSKSRIYRKVLHEQCQQPQHGGEKKIKCEKNIEALQHSKKGDTSDRKFLQCVVVE